MEQPAHELPPLWDAGTADNGFILYDTTLDPSVFATMLSMDLNN